MPAKSEVINTDGTHSVEFHYERIENVPPHVDDLSLRQYNCIYAVHMIAPIGAVRFYTAKWNAIDDRDEWHVWYATTGQLCTSFGKTRRIAIINAIKNAWRYA